MANWLKKVSKRSDALEPGELLLAAHQFQRSAVLGQGASAGTAGAVGGLVGYAAGAVVESKRAKREEARQEAVAEGSTHRESDLAWPGSSAILAVTDRRLLFFRMKGMSGAGEVFHRIPYGELEGLERHDVAGSLGGGNVKTLQLRFLNRDGTAVSAMAPNIALAARQLTEFVGALERASGRMAAG